MHEQTLSDGSRCSAGVLSFGRNRQVEVAGGGERVEQEQRGDGDEDEAEPEEQAIAHGRHV